MKKKKFNTYHVLNYIVDKYWNDGKGVSYIFYIYIYIIKYVILYPVLHFSIPLFLLFYTIYIYIYARHFWLHVSTYTLFQRVMVNLFPNFDNKWNKYSVHRYKIWYFSSSWMSCFNFSFPYKTLWFVSDGLVLFIFIYTFVSLSVSYILDLYVVSICMHL